MKLFFTACMLAVAISLLAVDAKKRTTQSTTTLANPTTTKRRCKPSTTTKLPEPTTKKRCKTTTKPVIPDVTTTKNGKTKVRTTTTSTTTTSLPPPDVVTEVPPDEDEIVTAEPIIVNNNCTISNAEMMKAFEAWLVKYGQTCVQGDELCQRMFRNFAENYRKITCHNQLYAQGLVSYELHLNEYSCSNVLQAIKDRALMEGDMTGFAIAPEIKTTKLSWPLSFNLEEKHSRCKVPVKSQGQCSGCYAFGAIAAIEFAICKKTGKRVILSEQQMLDCTGQKTKYRNKGCEGGRTYSVFEYVAEFQYVCLLDSDPYRAEANPNNCAEDHCEYYERFSLKYPYYYKLPSNDVDQMQKYLYEYGPLVCEINAQDHFSFYVDGVYCGEPTTCSPKEPNHVVLVIGWGYDRSSGKAYWICKNFWSTRWGKGGYVHIEMGKNICGIERSCRIPVVNSKRDYDDDKL